LDVFQQGEQKGFQRGRQEELQKSVRMLLERKFGETLEKIKLAEIADLQTWLMRIFDAISLDEIFK
jgi:predicted transposase YdaD